MSSPGVPWSLALARDRCIGRRRLQQAARAVAILNDNEAAVDHGAANPRGQGVACSSVWQEHLNHALLDVRVKTVCA